MKDTDNTTQEDAAILELFRKHYPNYAALVDLSRKDREYMIDSIAARHSYAAFKHGYQEAKTQS